MILDFVRYPLLFLKTKPSLSAALIVSIQIATALTFSQGQDVSEKILNFCQWDGRLYAHIVHFGYQSFHPLIGPIAQGEQGSNVGFFPGFPYLARLFYLLFRVREELCLAGAAHLFSFVFWYFLVKRLNRARIPGILQLLAVTLVLMHPASFYLVMPYSESLFLACLLSFLHFSELSQGKKELKTQILAFFSGFLMVGTRIFGVSLVFYPIYLQIFKKRLDFLSIRQGAYLSILALSSLFFFFAYCHVRFGLWNLYFQSQWVGWGVKADFRALWLWANYSYRCIWDRWALVTTVYGWMGILGLESLCYFFKVSRRGFLKRCPLYLLILGLFAMTVIGLFRRDFLSVVRYSLPWHVLMILNSAQIVRQFSRRKPKIRPYLLGLSFVIWVIVLSVFKDFAVFGLKRYLALDWFA